MENKANSQPADSYEQRDDLALRSAAGDPTVESRPNPQAQSPQHVKKPSISRHGATQSEPEQSGNSQLTKNPHSKNASVSGTNGEQLQAKGSLKPSRPRENETNPRSAQAIRSTIGTLPDFILQRNELFDRLKKEQHAEILAKEKPEINVVLDLGFDKEGKPRTALPVAAKAWESTPGSLLRHVDKDVSSDVVIAKVDGNQLWDLDRPLEYACRVSYVPFSSAEGRNVFWHSSAHVLGEAAECQFNCLLSHGPPVEQGFFYDMAIADGYVSCEQSSRKLTTVRQVVKETDWPPLESKASKYFKEKQPFERLHVSIADLKKMFGYSKYKMYYIENLLPPEGSTVYKCGTLVDLCLGPHIQNTGKIKAFQIMKVST